MKSYTAGNDTGKIVFWSQMGHRPRLESEERISEMNFSTGKHKQQKQHSRYFLILDLKFGLRRSWIFYR